MRWKSEDAASMTRCFPGLILLLFTSCEVENSTPSGGDPLSGETKRQDFRILAEQLETTVLPKVEFTDTPLSDAILNSSQPNEMLALDESADAILSSTKAAKIAFERVGISFAQDSAIDLDLSAMELRVTNLESEVNRIHD